MADDGSDTANYSPRTHTPCTHTHTLTGGRTLTSRDKARPSRVFVRCTAGIPLAKLFSSLVLVQELGSGLRLGFMLGIGFGLGLGLG